MNRNLHAVPLPRPKDAPEHAATSVCWCGPKPELVDLASMAQVYVHHDPQPEVRWSSVPWTCPSCGQRNSAGYQNCGRCDRSVTA